MMINTTVIQLAAASALLAFATPARAVFTSDSPADQLVESQSDRGKLPTAAGGRWKVITSDNPGGEDDSHVVMPGVEAFGVNLDGVVLIGEGPGDGYCTGALISDSHVLTAAHCEPAVNDSIGFETVEGFLYRRVTDAASHPQYLESENGYDIAVLTIDSPAPDSVPRYELYAGDAELGAQVVVAGYGSAGYGGIGSAFTDDRKRAGLNRYEAFDEVAAGLFGYAALSPMGSTLVYDFDDGTTARDAFGSAGGPVDLGFGPDEVNAGFGDSGGPTFIDDGGVYRIAGVVSRGESTNADVNSEIDASWGEVNIDTRVSAFSAYVESIVNAPPAEPSGLRYRVTPEASAFTDILATGTSVALDDDDFIEAPLGFDFEFYGEAYDSVFISSNGHLTLGAGSTSYEPEDLATESISSSQGLPLIAPFWEDLAPNDGGEILYETVESEGGSQLIVQWQAIEFYDSFETVTFQVILDEESGDIVFQYADVEGERAAFGENASVGIRAADGHLTGDAVGWSYLEASLANEVALRFELEVIPGDYNRDGLVDAADYTLWRDMNGTDSIARYVGADGNGDRRVDRLDYETWAGNFGRSDDLTTPSRTVPEPGAWAVCVGVMITLGTRNHRRT